MTPNPSATNFFSAAGEWTSSTSASPFCPMAMAWPEPTADGLDKITRLLFKDREQDIQKPESWVLVVVARMIVFSCA